MARLEAFVRPALAPDVRPIATPIVRQSSQPEDRIVTIGGNNSAAGLNFKHSESISYARQTMAETSRVSDTVRQMNPQDHAQFVDFDVMHGAKMTNEKGDDVMLRFRKPTASEHVQILRQNVVA